MFEKLLIQLVKAGILIEEMAAVKQESPFSKLCISLGKSK